MWKSLLFIIVILVTESLFARMGYDVKNKRMVIIVDRPASSQQIEYYQRPDWRRIDDNMRATQSVVRIPQQEDQQKSLSPRVYNDRAEKVPLKQLIINPDGSIYQWDPVQRAYVRVN